MIFSDKYTMWIVHQKRWGIYLLELSSVATWIWQVPILFSTQLDGYVSITCGTPVGIVPTPADIWGVPWPVTEDYQPSTVKNIVL